jgi:predicted polyphosphate/ATP-dependent NAD kinase
MSVGIIVNPASGKDIRRLVSHATIVDNKEKANIVKRAVIAATALGTRQFFIMPDTFMIGRVILESLKDTAAGAELVDMSVSTSSDDTIKAARIMEDKKVSCIILLGGDGTNRVASKSLLNTPVIPISSGTNNAYPSIIEGTVAGICAAYIDQSAADKLSGCIIKDKRIEIIIEGKLIDIALIDAVISKHSYAGARAIWDPKEIIGVVVTRAHPQNIGFSSMIGCIKTALPEDDFGYAALLNPSGISALAPIAPGVIENIRINMPELINLNEDYTYVADRDLMIALDGEREVKLAKGQKVAFRITRGGPLRADIKKTLESAQRNKFFYSKT